jgi:hypothetical protein
VFSTDLSDATADLRILARLTNLTGQNGRDAFPTITASNFVLAPTAVPEPSSVLLVAAGLLAIGARRRARQRHTG